MPSAEYLFKKDLEYPDDNIIYSFIVGKVINRGRKGNEFGFSTSWDPKNIVKTIDQDKILPLDPQDSEKLEPLEIGDGILKSERGVEFSHQIDVRGIAQTKEFSGVLTLLDVVGQTSSGTPEQK